MGEPPASEELLAKLRALVAQNKPLSPEGRERQKREDEAMIAETRARWRDSLPGPSREFKLPELVPLPEIEPLGPVDVRVVGTEPPADRPRPPRGAGAPDRLYPREEIARVVRAWRARHSAPQQISPRSLARPGFSHKAVRRVIRLDDEGAFRLGPRGGLWCAGINGEFRHAHKQESLRALELALGLPPLG